jgi:sarcosine oxidase
MASFDVAIVGLGAFGSAAAYWATARGSRVVAFERFELGHAKGASDDHSRIIRRTYDADEYLRFADAAFDAWAAVSEETGEQLVIPTGGLDLFPEDGTDRPEAFVEAMGLRGVVFELLDAREVRHRWPVWRLDDSVRAIYQPDAGVVAARRANEAHRRAAVGRGATLLERTPVVSVARDGEGFRVLTETDTYHAGSLIVTADAWMNEVLAPFGVRLQLRYTQEQVTYFDVSDPVFAPERFPVWIWHNVPHTYGLPAFGPPGPKVALHMAGPDMTPAERTFEPDPGILATVEAFTREHLPAAAGPVLETKTCQYTITPDLDFVLDVVPGVPGSAMALGTGHGFKFASAIGRALVELAVDGQSEWRLPRFAAERPGLLV